MFHVTVEERADLSATLTGPTSLVVAATGTEASYTATVTNAGPDTATSSKVTVQLPAAATHVSSSGGTGSDACSITGQLVTCTIANLASSSSRAFTILAKYQPGVGGLSLPATASLSAAAVLLGTSTADLDGANDVAPASTSLTAAPRLRRWPDRYPAELRHAHHHHLSCRTDRHPAELHQAQDRRRR